MTDAPTSPPNSPPPQQRFATHEVTNQPPPYLDVDLWAGDIVLRDAVTREGGGGAATSLAAFGRVCGSAEAAHRAREAERCPPRLETHDPQGRRRDRVVFHPAWHETMAVSIAAGLHASPWNHLLTPGTQPPPGAHVARAGHFYLATQMEAGHCCPVTMTHAAVPTLLMAPDLARTWLPRILSRSYDPAFRPASEKSGVTFGMGLTEKQGGTDVRANTTEAVPISSSGDGEHILTGHKWFLSAPMSDAFLMIAQTNAGPTCFLVPRFLPDGSLNALRLQRLKDKLGNRSNASCEVELAGAHGWRVGEDGRGIPTIIEMIMATRLDCAVSSAALMRQALAHAIHHTSHRTVFQKRLIDQPLMAHVLADMALDVEAATALAFRLARSFDHPGDAHETAWRRLMTPVTKFWVCKLAPWLIGEAMECLGGNGYVEELPLARLYREAPVNAIWEGSGNVMALDVLRVVQREPDTARTVLDEIANGASNAPAVLKGLSRISDLLVETHTLEVNARTLCETLAMTAAAALLQRHAPPAVADAFLATRLGGMPRLTYGQGLADWDRRAILARTAPYLS